MVANDEGLTEAQLNGLIGANRLRYRAVELSQSAEAALHERDAVKQTLKEVEQVRLRPVSTSKMQADDEPRSNSS